MRLVRFDADLCRGARALLRDGIRDYTLQHGSGLALVDRDREHGKDVRAFDRRADLLLLLRSGKHQQYCMRRPGVREGYLVAHVGDVSTVEYENLTAFGVVQVLECSIHRVDGAYGSLAPQGLAELEQEVVARGDGGDIHRGPVGRTEGAGGGAGRRALYGPGGIRRWTCHNCVSAVMWSPESAEVSRPGALIRLNRLNKQRAGGNPLQKRAEK